MPKPGFVYMMTNQACTVLYTGVTSQLPQRVWQHKNGTVPGFTSKYRLNRLVYYELCEDIRGAIEREKQIKSWSRAKKEALVRAMNPMWRDLSEDIMG